MKWLKILIASFIAMSGIWWWNAHEFDSGSWLQGDKLRRNDMADSLVDSKRLVGLSKEQVQALLGPPDSDVDIDIYSPAEAHRLWRYELNDDSLFGKDRTLMVGFQKNNIVSFATARKMFLPRLLDR